MKGQVQARSGARLPVDCLSAPNPPLITCFCDDGRRPVSSFPAAGRMSSLLSAGSPGGGKAFQEEGLLLLAPESCPSGSFRLPSHGRSPGREEDLVALLCSPLGVCSPSPDPGRMLTSPWTAPWGPPVALLVSGHPPWTLSVGSSLPSSRHAPQGRPRSPGIGVTQGSFFPSRGLKLNLQRGLNPSFAQGPLFQVCSFSRYCFQALENSLGSLPCYNDNV